jgi:hypothetical protein
MGALFIKYVIFNEDDYEILKKENKISDLTFEEREEIMNNNQPIFEPLKEHINKLRDELI